MAESIVTKEDQDQDQEKYDPDYDELLAALQNPDKVKITPENALDGDDGKPDPQEDEEDEQDEPEKEDKIASPGSEDGEDGKKGKGDEEEQPPGEEADKQTPEPTDEKGAGGDAGAAALNKELMVEMQEMKRQMQEMKLALAKAEAKAVSPAPTKKDPDDKGGKDPLDGLFDDEDDKGGKGDEAGAETRSTIEVLEAEIQDIADKKGSVFDVQLDTMAQTKEYADVKEVCTAGNLKDMVSDIASILVEKNGGNYAERYLQVELSIWSRDNPFKYMYNLIKDHHPAYAKPAEKDGSDKNKGNEDDKDKNKDGKQVRKPEPTDAPGSIEDMGSGAANNQSGWTAAKIDALPEDQLHTVPDDVYDLYMQGKLK